MTRQANPGYATIEALLIRLDANASWTSLIEELNVLQRHQVLKVIDVMVVNKGRNDDISARSQTELTPDEADELRRVMVEALGFEANEDTDVDLHWDGVSVLLGPADVRTVADMLAPGQSALAVLFEHRWAARLSQLIRDMGVSVLEDEVLTPELMSGRHAGPSMW